MVAKRRQPNESPDEKCTHAKGRTDRSRSSTSNIAIKSGRVISASMRHVREKIAKCR